MRVISVVIPVFNRIEPLRRALRSVFNQTSKNFEVIVVDDHSSLNVKAVCEEFPVTYMKTSGKGVSAARNTGIQAAQTEFVAFLDSDDEWQPEKLQKQIEYLNANPEISIVHTNEVWIRNGQKVKQAPKHQKFGGRIFDKCCELCIIAPSSVLAKKTLFDQVGLFDEEFTVCEDFDLWLRITSEHEVGFLTEELTIKHGGHEDQLSMKHHSMDLWRVRALAKHLKNPNLNETEMAALRKSLVSKSQILIKGFEKHQNFKQATEVQEYLRSAQI